MGGPLGVRRPLRFLAHKLDLERPQIAALAGIIDDIKTERAQAEVDHRRARKALAELFTHEEFPQEKAQEVAEQRAATVRKLQETIAQALAQIHALLNEQQRETLSYLIRTGALSL